MHEDKGEIQAFVFNTKLVEWANEATSKQKQPDGSEKTIKQNVILSKLKQDIILNEQFWKQLEGIVKLCEKGQMWSLLRLTDTEEANLHHVPSAFYSAKGCTIEVANDLVNEEVLTRQNVLTIESLFTKKEKEVVSDISRAAAYINPNHVYGKPDDPSCTWVCPRGQAAFGQVVTSFFHADYTEAGEAPGSIRRFSKEELIAKRTRVIDQAAKFVNGSIPEMRDAEVQRQGQGADCANFFRCFGYLVPDLAPLAIALVSQASGQGPAERAHRITGMKLNKATNRQDPAVTDLYCKVAMECKREQYIKDLRKNKTATPTTIQVIAMSMMNKLKTAVEARDAAQQAFEARVEQDALPEDHEDGEDEVEEFDVDEGGPGEDFPHVEDTLFGRDVWEAPDSEEWAKLDVCQSLRDALSDLDVLEWL